MTSMKTVALIGAAAGAMTLGCLTVSAQAAPSAAPAEAPAVQVQDSAATSYDRGGYNRGGNNYNRGGYNRGGNNYSHGGYNRGGNNYNRGGYNRGQGGFVVAFQGFAVAYNYGNGWAYGGR